MPQASEPDCPPDQIHLAFLASPVGVRDALARILALPPLVALSAEARGTAELVLAEVLNNVAEHAYADQPGHVELTIRRDDRGLGCLVVDQGRAMPAGQPPEGRLPDGPHTGLDDLPEGGFGWHLIRSLTENLHYARLDGRNRLAFHLPQPG